MLGRKTMERSQFTDERMSDYLIDIVTEDGVICWLNPAQAELVGAMESDGQELLAEAIYDTESVARIRGVLLRKAAFGFSTTLELQLFSRGGRRIRTIGRATIVLEGGKRAVRLSKVELGVVAVHYDQMTSDLALLSSIITSAKEAHWAIVFVEPVDITQTREEVIRQVFENQSIWRMCNPAMARFYGLPEDMDLNTQSVRLYWPRSTENEAFVNHIIDGGYSVDNAISVDRKHDGTAVYVSNDVRAQIVDGYLRCLWGNIRNTETLSDGRQRDAGTEE